jgi:hypothetical protein
MAELDLVPLREAIEALRTEIMEAAATGANQLVSFLVGPIELEFNVVAKREGAGKANVKFGILGLGAEIGGDLKVTGETTQKVKITLTPQVTNPVTGLRDPAVINRPGS